MKERKCLHSVCVRVPARVPARVRARACVCVCVCYSSRGGVAVDQGSTTDALAAADDRGLRASSPVRDAGLVWNCFQTSAWQRVHSTHRLQPRTATSHRAGLTLGQKTQCCCSFRKGFFPPPDRLVLDTYPPAGAPLHHTHTHTHTPRLLHGRD